MLVKERWDYPEVALEPEHYRVFVNPKITGATKLKLTDLEYCASFIG